MSTFGDFEASGSDQRYILVGLLWNSTCRRSFQEEVVGKLVVGLFYILGYDLQKLHIHTQTFEREFHIRKTRM